MIVIAKQIVAKIILMRLHEIDPENPIDYKQSDEQLQHHLIWLILAAGKNGRKAAKTAWGLVQDLKLPPLRFFCSLPHEELARFIKNNGGGCYNQKADYIQGLGPNPNLRSMTRTDLVKFKGIKYKTASCFLLHTRPKVKMIGLDRHVMRHLHEIDPYFPSKPPHSKKDYLKYEARAIDIALKCGVSPARFDLDIWRLRSVRLD